MSIRSHLIVSYLLVILLAMGIAAGIAWTILDRAFLDVLRDNLLAQARRVAQTTEASDMSQFGAGLQLDPYSQLANVQPGYHTRIIDVEGVVILGASTTPITTSGATNQLPPDATYAELASNLGLPPSDMPGQRVPTADLLSRSEIQRGLAGEAATAVRSYDWAPGRRVLYAAYPIRSSGASTASGATVGVVYVASPLPRMTLSLLPDYFGAQILAGISLAIASSGLIGLLLARQLTHPLRRLTDASLALARGDSVPPLPLTSTTELRTLGEAFNTMNANLTDAYSTLASQAHQREAMLTNLADAVLATDRNGDIVLANPAASILMIAGSQPLHHAIQHALEIGQPYATEITARDQVIELLITPLSNEQGHISGSVAVGHDVTAYRQLNRLRSSFVSDVSHELRTPLTAIKGFVETLQDGAADDPAVRDRFLDTIAVETERLIRLTNGLLLLSRADAGRLDLHLAPTSLVAAVRRATAQLDPSTRERERRITCIIEQPEPSARILALADPDRIHQVLINLLDNANKFTPDRGHISISIAHSGDQALCTVTNTGPGIPPEEIPHLFERFYRGDPSRAHSRDKSGAGLGLAIAKAIVQAHGGDIWIESEPGQTTSVTFTLPSAT